MLTCWFSDHKWCIREVAHYDARLYSLYAWECSKCYEKYKYIVTQWEMAVSDILGSYLPKSKLRDRNGNFIGFLKLWKEVCKC